MIRDTWTRVKADVEAGSPTPAAADVAAVEGAIQAGTPAGVAAVLSVWEGLRAAADAGYSVRGIDAGVASSLRLRLTDFGVALREFAGVAGGGS